ncbi:unnamed protein product, partial [Phaeothamnion confervicola]
MHRQKLSTAARPAPGQPIFSRAEKLSQTASEAILACAALGPLRRAGRGWYAPDKARPFHQTVVAALIKRRLLIVSRGRTAFLTLRGLWLARTMGSAAATRAL